VVQKQVNAGIDTVSDGEMGKPGFFLYAAGRLNGMEERSAGNRMSVEADFPGYYEWRAAQGANSPFLSGRPVCTGPLSWKDHDSLDEEIRDLQLAVAANGASEAFMPSASVGIIAQRIENQYYPTYE